MTAIELEEIVERVGRADADAGSDPWLVGYDANAIQELITASGRPISMRGASEAISEFDKRVCKHELAIFAGGGRGVVLARSQKEADEQARALVERYRTATRGGIMASCAVRFERGGDAEAHSIRWLRHRLEIAKGAALPPGGALPTGKEDECAYCRRYLAAQQRTRDGQPERVCVQCSAMLDRGNDAERQRGERRGEMSQSIAEIATEGWIAVVSADGNNLGALFESLGSLVELAVVSQVVADSFRSAQRQAIEPIPEKQRLPLVTGGDDVRAFLPPGEVLGYVERLTRGVESAAADHARAAGGLISHQIADDLGKLGIGIGAVIANVYYPAWRLVEYAHKLEGSAKAACRKHRWRSGFDFTVVTTEDTMAEQPARALEPGDFLPLMPGSEPWRKALDSARALAQIPSAQLAILAAAPVEGEREGRSRGSTPRAQAQRIRDGERDKLDTDQAAPSRDWRASDEELGNLLRYQVARSKEWRAWYTACGVDWRDPADVFKRRPTRDALQLARLLGFGEPSR